MGEGFFWVNGLVGAGGLDGRLGRVGEGAVLSSHSVWSREFSIGHSHSMKAMLFVVSIRNVGPERTAEDLDAGHVDIGITYA